MKISEAISYLQSARKQLGDVDVVYVKDQQFQDIDSITPHRKPTPDLKWCWSGPVVVVELSE